MPPPFITIGSPSSGTQIAPNQMFSGTYGVGNGTLDRIVCRVVFPASSMVIPLVWEKGADHAAAGAWDVTFVTLPQGLDATFQVELFLQGVADRVDSDTVEDLDILAAGTTPGTLGVPTLLPIPMPILP